MTEKPGVLARPAFFVMMRMRLEVNGNKDSFLHDMLFI